MGGREEGTTGVLVRGRLCPHTPYDSCLPQNPWPFDRDVRTARGDQGPTPTPSHLQGRGNPGRDEDDGESDRTSHVGDVSLGEL